VNRSRSILKALAFLSAGLVLAWSASMAQASRSPGGSGSTSGGSGSTSGGGDTIDAPDPKIDDSSSGGPDSSDQADEPSGSSHGGSGDSSSNDSGDDSGSHGGSSDSGSGDSGTSGSSGDSGTSGGSLGGSGDSGTSGGSGSGGSSGGSGDSGTSGGSGDGGTSGGSSGTSGKSGSNSSGDEQSSSGNTHTTADNKSGSTNSSGAAKVESYLEIAETEHGDRYVKGEVVIMSSRHDMASLISKGGLKVIESFSLASMGLNGYRVQVPSNADEQKVLGQLRKLDPKSIATLNHVYVPARGVTTNLPGDSAVASVVVSKRTNARIGLVDAHVDSKHPLLKSVRVASRVFGVANAVEDNHGTAVASRIAEVAPGATLFVASVFSEMSSGNEIASVYAIAKGLSWLSDNKVPVINLSLTGPSNPILQDITSRLTAQGFLLVAAVGNEGPHAPAQYPAAYDGVIGVTAVDDQQHVYLYANQGSYVDFAARGVNRVVATGAGKTETASGTSFAAPVIAVALARLLPRPDKALASKAEAELERQAKDLGEPGRDSVFGFGVIEPTPVD
jgi:hypothetical protein